MAVKKDTFIEVDLITIWLFDEGYPFDWQTEIPPHKGIRTEFAFLYQKRLNTTREKAIRLVYDVGKWSLYLKNLGLDPYDNLLQKRQ